MSRFSYIITSFILIIALPYACYISEPEDGELVISTNKTVYTSTELMTVTFTNSSDHAYLLLSSGCSAENNPLPELVYEYYVQGEWENVGGLICPGVFQPPVLLKSRTEYSVTFMAYVISQEFVPGEYRIRFMFSDHDGHRIPPEAQTVSNVFEIQ